MPYTVMNRPFSGPGKLLSMVVGFSWVLLIRAMRRCNGIF